MSNTPYDDVFRTLLNDCSSLVLPLLNEVFQESYTGEEEIEFISNEHFINQQDGEEKKKITDTCFVVKGDEKKWYHWECQSTEDKKILVRIFEYDAQIALDYGEVKEDVLEVEFPNSAVLSLRGGPSASDRMKIRIKTSGGIIEYWVPVMKMCSYTLDEIFQKRLFFLLPFYIFTHEREFEEYEKNEKKLEKLKEEYLLITAGLEELAREGALGEYEKCVIVDMSKRVLKKIASKYGKVQKGVREIMGGQILEHEAKTILNRGKKEGIKEGIDSFADLTGKLLRANRLEDLERATEDETFREQIYEELGIKLSE